MNGVQKVLILSVVLGVLSAGLFLSAANADQFGNRAPFWNYTGNKTVYSGQVLQFTVNATDPDSDLLHYSILDLPAGAWFAPSTHTFYWVPGEDQVGTYTLTFTVTDGDTIIYQNVGVAVLSNRPSQPNPQPASIPAPTPTSVNHAPQFYGFAPSTGARVNELYTYDVNATGADGDVLAYTLISAPSGAVINYTTGYLAWVPIASQTGSNYFRVTVSDGRSQTTADFYVTASPAIFTPAPQTTSYSGAAPAATDQPAETKLAISDIKFENKNGEIVVNWKTNIAATDRAIWDTASQADKRSNFTYANATLDNTDRSISHSANLGKLETDTVYYLRVVSKTDSQTAVSQEIAFIQLAGGEVKSLFGASLIGIFESLFHNAAFLWILIAGLGTAAIIFYRKHKKASVTI